MHSVQLQGRDEAHTLCSIQSVGPLYEKHVRLGRRFGDVSVLSWNRK